MRLFKQFLFAAALVLAVAPLSADIIWSGEQVVYIFMAPPDSEPASPTNNIPISPSAIWLDVNEDGLDDFHVGDVDPIHPLWFYVNCSGDNKHTGNWIGDVGRIIDGSLDWTGGEHLLVSWMLLLDDGQAGVGAWLGQTGYMGIQFEAADGTHSGWIYMTVPEEEPGMIVHSWAYESTPGIGIVAGAVPEPSSALLALIGAMSVWLLRRQNRISRHWKES